ncbi:MAG: VOC family protein [Pseudomonadota bacterium]
MSELIHTLGPFEFDHIALGVCDTRKGPEWIERLTGAKVVMIEPEEGQYYWSNALLLPHGGALEIIGPNPAHRGFHPVKQMLRSYAEPTPFFWHLGAADFGAVCQAAKAAGGPVERIEHIDDETPSGRRVYSRGIIGPGFRSSRPCIVHWRQRPDRPEMRAAPQCEVVGFELTSPKAAATNKVLEALGVRLRVKPGAEHMRIRLKTPNGDVELDGDGTSFEGIGALPMLLKLWTQYIITRN